MSIRFGRSGNKSRKYTLLSQCLYWLYISGNGYDSSEVMETEDDDWRKVTDLNERRKIQNRLAQRNYRESSLLHDLYFTRVFPIL